MTDTADNNVTSQTSEIVAAFVSRNPTQTADLPALIHAVYATLTNLGGNPALPVSAEPVKPAVPVRKSITPDYLVCLEDGKKLKMLKRHLASTYNLSPDEYRTKWNLPHDYPMVAPNYSQQRSSLAKKLGLGLQNRGPAPAPTPAARGRGRGRPPAQAAA